MKNDLESNIKNVVARTKAHKDTFAVPQLIAILQETIQNADHEENSPEEIIIFFVGVAVDAIANSPIYSDALVRELYRNVIETADSFKLRKDSLLEDLLFQSLKKTVDIEKTKRKKVQDVRSKILKSALDEFSERGFHAATIDSIADRAGIAKGTVYRYFKTKEALFNELKEDTITEFTDLARRDLSGQDDILNIIESVIRIYLTFFEHNSAFFKVIIQEHRDFGRDFSEKFINELILGLPGLKRRCWKASRQGRLKQMNYFTVFYGIIGFLNGVIQKWLHEGAEGSLLSEIDTVKEVLFYGFAVPPEQAQKTSGLKVIS